MQNVSKHEQVEGKKRKMDGEKRKQEKRKSENCKMFFFFFFEFNVFALTLSRVEQALSKVCFVFTARSYNGFNFLFLCNQLNTQMSGENGFCFLHCQKKIKNKNKNTK